MILNLIIKKKLLVRSSNTARYSTRYLIFIIPAFSRNKSGARSYGKSIFPHFLREYRRPKTSYHSRAFGELHFTQPIERYICTCIRIRFVRVCMHVCLCVQSGNSPRRTKGCNEGYVSSLHVRITYLAFYLSVVVRPADGAFVHRCIREIYTNFKGTSLSVTRRNNISSLFFIVCLFFCVESSMTMLIRADHLCKVLYHNNEKLSII